MNKELNLIKIITTDHWASICWLIPAAFIGGTLALFIKIFIDEGKFEPISFFIYWLSGIFLLTIFCTFLLLKRISYYSNIKMNGFALNGNIVEILRGGVHYMYEYMNEKHESIFSTAFKKKELLRGKTNIIVVVDKTNPKRSYIQDLFV